MRLSNSRILGSVVGALNSRFQLSRVLLALALMTGGGRPAFAEVDRLDPVLDDPAKTYPVFVRMEEQLFRKAGEYEAFCKTNKKLRSELRDWVLETLQSKSNASWEQIEGMIGELQKEGSLKNVKRYWIVNGFACLATGKACRRLAASDLVSLV